MSGICDTCKRKCHARTDGLKTCDRYKSNLTESIKNRVIIKVIEVESEGYLQIYVDNYGKGTYTWIDNCYSAEETATRIQEELEQRGW